MSAEIFSAPKEIKLPKIDFANYNHKKRMEAEEKYVKDLKAFLTKNGYKGKNVGEIIRFPVGDGHAEYMVVSLRPLQLIHLELGDAWSFQQAHLLTAKEVNRMIETEKKIAKMFANRE